MSRTVYTGIVITVLSAGLLLASTSTAAQQHFALAATGQMTAGSIVKGDINSANFWDYQKPNDN